jgi:hypothetical protein
MSQVMRRHFETIMQRRMPDLEMALERTFTTRLDSLMENFVKDSRLPEVMVVCADIHPRKLGLITVFRP